MARESTPELDGMAVNHRVIRRTRQFVFPLVERNSEEQISYKNSDHRLWPKVQLL